MTCDRTGMTATRAHSRYTQHLNFLCLQGLLSVQGARQEGERWEVWGQGLQLSFQPHLRGGSGDTLGH